MPTAQQLRRQRAARKRRSVTGSGIKFRAEDEFRRNKYGKAIGRRRAATANDRTDDTLDPSKKVKAKGKVRPAKGFETITDAKEGGVTSSGGEQTAKVSVPTRRPSKSKKTTARATKRKVERSGMSNAAANVLGAGQDALDYGVGALQGLSKEAADAVKQTHGMGPAQTEALAGGPTGPPQDMSGVTNNLFPNPLLAAYMQQIYGPVAGALPQVPQAAANLGANVMSGLPPMPPGPDMGALQAGAAGAAPPPGGIGAGQMPQMPQMPQVSPEAMAYGAQQGGPQGPQQMPPMPPVGQATSPQLNPLTGGAYMLPPGLEGILAAILGGQAPIYGPQGQGGGQ